MDPYIGDVRLFAGNFAPVGWVLCNGALLSISEYDALYALIGNIYGGDGITTFAVPDLRGRIPVGQGTGPGLSSRTIGSAFGTETVTLLQQNMPAHSHSFNGSSAAASAAVPTNNVFAQTAADTIYTEVPSQPDLQTMNAASVQNSGGTQPHDNIMSTTAINYIMCTQGVFPSRN
jgi:microcystin-dependent protein